MNGAKLVCRIFVSVLFLQLTPKVIKSEKINLDRFPTLLFFNKEKVSIIESYEYISLPIQLEFKKRQITSLSSKIQHIKSFKKITHFFSEGKRRFLSSLLRSLNHSYRDLQHIEQITMNTTIHTKFTKRGLINDAAKIGLKLIGNLVKEVFPANYVINTANNRYLNKDMINLHEIERVRTRSRHAFETSMKGADKLATLMNETMDKVTKLEITTTIMKLGDDINHLQDTIEQLKNNIMKLIYTNRLPVNLIDDKSISSGIDKLKNKLRNKGRSLVTENPYMMKSTLGYNYEDHTLHIILKAPTKIDNAAFKMRLLNKFIVAKVNNELKILEIESSRYYYQQKMFGKTWYNTNNKDVSKPAKLPIVWQKSKPECHEALEKANNSMIFEKCHFKETNKSMQIEPISKSIVCIHKVTSQTAKLTCNDKMKIINLIAGSTQLQMDANCILENNDDAIFLSNTEQNDKETFQLSIELSANSIYDGDNENTDKDAIKITFSLTVACTAITLAICLYGYIAYLKIAMWYCKKPAKTNTNNDNNN